MTLNKGASSSRLDEFMMSNSQFHEQKDGKESRNSGSIKEEKGCGIKHTDLQLQIVDRINLHLNLEKITV